MFAELTVILGFLIIWAKLSDIFGRKLVIVTSVSLFVVFSAACGGAQTMSQLLGISTLLSLSDGLGLKSA